MGKKVRNRARRTHWADEDDEINPESDTRLPGRSGPIGFGDPSPVDQLKMDRPLLPTLNKLVPTESERDVSNDATPSLGVLDNGASVLYIIAQNLRGSLNLTFDKEKYSLTWRDKRSLHPVSFKSLLLKIIMNNKSSLKYSIGPGNAQ